MSNPHNPINDVGGWLFDPKKRPNTLQRIRTALGVKMDAVEVVGVLVLDALQNAFSIGLGSVLEDEWVDFRSMQKSAEESLRPVPQVIQVRVADHQLTPTIPFQLDVHLPMHVCISFDGAVIMSIGLAGTQAELRSGRLTALLGGRAELSGQVKIGEIPVVSTAHVSVVKLPSRLALGSGVVLAR